VGRGNERVWSDNEKRTNTRPCDVEEVRGCVETVERGGGDVKRTEEGEGEERKGGGCVRENINALKLSLLAALII
jgi:hypothetical protein